jgi:hypothetical protein
MDVAKSCLKLWREEGEFMAIVRCAVVGCLLGGMTGCGSEGFSDAGPIGSETQQFVDCRNATSDRVLNSKSSQVTPVVTYSGYDNPGCDESYVVDYNGTVNGGQPYGYKLNTPRPGTNDGIRVSFGWFDAATPDQCEFFYARADLYEKVGNNPWAYKTGRVRFPDGWSPDEFGCFYLHPVVFADIQRGSEASPRAYRVVVHVDADGADHYPDGIGYGQNGLWIGAYDDQHPWPP